MDHEPYTAARAAEGTSKLTTDQGILWDWTFVRSAIAGRPTGIRYGQAIYNWLWSQRQAGIPDTWPELFYQPDPIKAENVLFSRYDLIDNFLVPK